MDEVLYGIKSGEGVRSRSELARDRFLTVRDLLPLSQELLFGLFYLP
ncbi:Cobyrinic acid a,c-diamide synthase (fragment) [Candidatus Methylomirabilis oxygeniifera]|uniref:Cobyrinic acid a,c-diamide synthase n=1 Tax=Methylomirabilis oxygeniifera TaxID=671143 RepID=D5MHD5_METO1